MRIFSILFLVCFSLSAQEMRLKKGVVIDSLPVGDTINESYSLYLPLSFEPNSEPKPIIFLLDEQGRGKAAAQLFKTAAEEQGYILASSNNIKTSNTLAENLGVAVRLMEAVTATIPTDFDRISVAGFGEGAKVATSMPAVLSNLHGVMAIGDNRLNFEFLNKKNKFIFVGLAGDEDFASYGISATAAELERRGYPTAVYIFDGGYEWPNAGLISLGVSSLTLEAMREGKEPKDQEAILSFYSDDLGRVNKLISTGENIKAYNLLEVLQSKYEGLVNLRELEYKQRQLSRSRNFTEEQGKSRTVQDKENRLIEDFIYYFNEDVATANFENLGWWNYQKLELQKLAESENDLEADMALRLLNMLDKMGSLKRVEMEASEKTTLESKLLANMIHTIFDQQDFQAYKNIISLSAQDGDFGTALFYLEEMLKNGYKDMESLYEIEGTLGLRLTPEYNWLMKKYLGTSKFYDEE